MKTKFLEVCLATAMQNILYYMHGKTTDQAIEIRDEAVKNISKWVDKFGLMLLS